MQASKQSMGIENRNKEVKRLFIAIDLPHELKEYLYLAASEYFSGNNAVRVIPAENIHLTLKFLGSVDILKTHRISVAIQSTSSNFGMFDYMISDRLNAFPSENSARIIFAGVKEGYGKIMEIFKVLETNLGKIRIKKEERRFVSHITVARIRDRKNISGLLGSAGLAYDKPVRCDKLTLFESILRPSGAQYTILKEFALK